MGRLGWIAFLNVLYRFAARTLKNLLTTNLNAHGPTLSFKSLELPPVESQVGGRAGPDSLEDPGDSGECQRACGAGLAGLCLSPGHGTGNFKLNRVGDSHRGQPRSRCQ